MIYTCYFIFSHNPIQKIAKMSWASVCFVETRIARRPPSTLASSPENAAPTPYGRNTYPPGEFIAKACHLFFFTKVYFWYTFTLTLQCLTFD